MSMNDQKTIAERIFKKHNFCYDIGRQDFDFEHIGEWNYKDYTFDRDIIITFFDSVRQRTKKLKFIVMFDAFNKPRVRVKNNF